MGDRVGAANLQPSYRELKLRCHECYILMSAIDECAAMIKYWMSIEGSQCNTPVLPFGATASVAAFLRLSSALNLALVAPQFVGLVFATTLFPCPAQKIRKVLFAALGWELSTGEEKDKPFAYCFQALGVEFDLSNVGQGSFRISNRGASCQN